MFVQMEEEYLTPDEVADKLRVDQDTILRWLKSGYLIGYKVGRQWRISRTDYANFLRDKRNTERGTQEK